MIRSRFAQGLDTFLFVVASSLVVYAWVRKYIKLTWASIIITGIISFIAAKIIWDITTSKYNKRKLKTQELKFAQNCITHLALYPGEALPLFKKIITGSKVDGEFLIAGNTLYYFDYSAEQTTTATISKILQKLKTSKLDKCELFTSSVSSKAQEVLGTLNNINIVADYDAYIMMKDKETYPITEEKSAKMHKNRLKQVLNMAFSAKKVKPYLGYGLLLLFVSFIMPYTFLYCLIGTLFIVLALICLIKKHIKKPSAA